MIRGILRPNAPYQQHIRAGVQFLAGGREFVVDDRAERDVVDEPGRPLVLSSKGFAYMRQEFGRALVCEPLGGGDLGDATEHISRIEERAAHLERQLGAREKDVARVEAELADAKKKIAELEKAVANTTKPARDR